MTQALAEALHTVHLLRLAAPLDATTIAQGVTGYVSLQSR